MAADEDKRLDALRCYRILDTAPEPEFDEIAALAARACGVPAAFIAFVDDHRLWFKAKTGIMANTVPRSRSSWETRLHYDEVLQAADAASDPRFCDNPLVAGEPHLRFCAAVGLGLPQGPVLGTLWVMDYVRRDLDDRQCTVLRGCARQVMLLLELRRSRAELDQAIRQRDRSERQLRLQQQKLELRIRERTAAVDAANAKLRQQYVQRAREAAELQTLIDSLPGIFYVFDADGHFLRWNRNLERLTCRSHDEVARSHPLDLFAPGPSRERVEDAIRRVLSDGCAAVEAELISPDGRRTPYYFNGVHVDLGGIHCISGMGIDISERRRSEAALRLRDRALQASLNAIIITDLEGNIEYANPAFEKITGYTIEETLGRNCRFLQNGDSDQPGLEMIRSAIHAREEGVALLRNYRKDGQFFWNDVHIAPVPDPDGSTTHFVGVLNDITDIKEYEARLARQENVDALTELASRAALKNRIRQAILAAQRGNSVVTVGFMDLDNFKFINDSLGHNIGDKLLRRVARRLSACVREHDMIARYGGDEFAFVLTGQQDKESVSNLMRRMLKTVDRPFNIDGHQLFVSCSIGVSFYPKDGLDVDTLLRDADAAMYRAKEAGRNTFQFYTPALNLRVTERLSMEARLRRALANDEFILHYQPKVDLRSGTMVGIEALLRWLPEKGEMVPPAVFIPLAEETGLIVAIGEWVLRTACSDAKMLQDTGLATMRVAVNISARQFEPNTLTTVVRDALHDSGLASECLELELTESLVMQNPEEVISVLRGLKEMGLRLAIDDFGTGYSSLSYLQRFPVDRLKIDQSFVRDIGADPNDAIIARAVISLGHSLGMSVIAEGVSSREQLIFLRENGCDEIQGYLFSRPVPIEELAVLLRENRML